jgi:hypothetical protein
LWRHRSGSFDSCPTSWPLSPSWLAVSSSNGGVLRKPTPPPAHERPQRGPRYDLKIKNSLPRNYIFACRSRRGQAASNRAAKVGNFLGREAEPGKPLIVDSFEPSAHASLRRIVTSLNESPHQA